MNAQIESGFVAILQAALPSVPVREATSSLPLHGDVQIAIVECPEVQTS